MGKTATPSELDQAIAEILNKHVLDGCEDPRCDLNSEFIGEHLLEAVKQKITVGLQVVP